MKTLQVMAGVFGMWAGLLLAAETVTDQTQFKVRTNAGAVESVTVEGLAVGETRTLRSAAGTPVVVGRHEGGYVLDINGERIEVDAPQVDIVGSGPMLVSAGSGKHVLVHVDDEQSSSGQPHNIRKVMVVKRGDSATGSDLVLTGDDAQVIVDQLDLDDAQLADGKKVVVMRKVIKRKTAD